MSDLIVLSGYIGSGKDTVGNILVEKHGYERESFAAPLYKMLYAINPRIDGIPLADLVDSFGWDYVKRTYIEVRGMLQSLGQSAREQLGGGVFVERVDSVYWLEGAESARGMVVTDGRLDDEFMWCSSIGGKVVRVDNPRAGESNRHSLERICQAPDYIIVNDGTLEDLHKKVEELLHAIEQ